MGSYKIVWKKSTERDIRKIDPKQVPRLIEAIESLIEDPFPLQCHRLRGTEKLYRIRIGDYRVIYEVNKEEKTITIITFAIEERLTEDYDFKYINCVQT